MTSSYLFNLPPEILDEILLYFPLDSLKYLNNLALTSKESNLIVKNYRANVINKFYNKNMKKVNYFWIWKNNDSDTFLKFKNYPDKITDVNGIPRINKILSKILKNVNMINNGYSYIIQYISPGNQ